ncbi:MAG: OmpH family outer membrane protein [Prevotella sp.]|nr:OmpH family outer membrane protein [Prevotella sp.]
MKHLILLFTLLLTLPMTAQETQDPAVLLHHQPTVCIGYVSYDSALAAMPQQAIVQQQVQQLREAYDRELQRTEKEFNQKYEAFLDGMKDFPRTILLKRQNELQQLLQQNLEFKRKGRADLRKAEQEAMEPLRQQLKAVIAKVAKKYALTLVVNTDSNACPFIDTDLSVDINKEVVELLNAESAEDGKQ